MIASLESKGYVAREPSARDGRSVEFALTATGDKAIKRDPLLAIARDIEEATGGDPAALLGEPLSEADSRAICAEQEPASV